VRFEQRKTRKNFPDYIN